MLKSYKAALAASTVALLGLSAAADRAQAETMDVSATVESACKIVVDNGIGFGNIDSTSDGASTTDGEVTVQNCGAGTATLQVDGGENPDAGGAFFALAQTDVTQKLRYLVTNKENSQTMGQNEATAVTTFAGVNKLIQFSAQLETADLQTAPTGNYTDQLELTFTFAPS